MCFSHPEFSTIDGRKVTDVLCNVECGFDKRDGVNEADQCSIY